MLIRGVEVSSKEVVDHTGSPRQHVLLGRTDRETGTDRAGSTAQRCVLAFFAFFAFFFFCPFSMYSTFLVRKSVRDRHNKSQQEWNRLR